MGGDLGSLMGPLYLPHLPCCAQVVMSQQLFTIYTRAEGVSILLLPLRQNLHISTGIKEKSKLEAKKLEVINFHIFILLQMV